jgi:hypothetical protein
MRLWRDASPATKLHFRRHHLLNTALTDRDRNRFALLVSTHDNDPYVITKRTKALSYALICADPWTQNIIARVRPFNAHDHVPHSIVLANRRRPTSLVWWYTAHKSDDSLMSPDDFDFFKF